MNSINLVISGNLTGFSRFYATPTANDVLNDAKFDFDYRNFLTFLNSGDKAYAVSFSPSVLAVSLVTRILDSFRRPGVLVVTLLLPRRSKVESAMNPQNKNALYQLLNEINDKFYEKNFVNGMVNQNAAVLMQDYYTEILGNYVLVSDGMQRGINATIDVTSPNKRLGYVQTTEDNVPLYLASPCRRNYEGCHHVFFAQNPVQNLIAEEPVEVVYYRAQITNNRQTLPSVTLNDRIPNLRPDEGEIDIDKNFTYQQVINGEAGRNIIAELRGETIEITYRFGLEEKTIKFVFNENGREIPFTAVMPVLEFNGTFINIPSETYTFQGKEIYGSKRIKSRGTEYRVKRESENLDLRRLQDTCIVQVEHCFSISIFFNQPEDKQKRIVFKSNHGSFPFTDVTNHLDAVLPGYPEEYSYTIESLFYEKESGYLATSGTQIQLPQLKPVSRNTQPPRQGGLKLSDTPMQPRGRQAASNVNSGNRTARYNETYAQSVGKPTGGALQLGGGDINQEQFHESKGDKFIKAIPYIAGIVGLGIICFLLHLFNIWPFTESKGKKDVDEIVKYEQLVRIHFEDATHDPLTLEDFKDYGRHFEEFNNLVDVILQDESGNSIQSDNPDDTANEVQYLYRIETSKQGDNEKYSFQIKIRNTDIVIGSSDIYTTDFSGIDGDVYDKTINLCIKTSELLAYKKALDYGSGKEMLIKVVNDSIVRPANNLTDINRGKECEKFGNMILEIIKPKLDEASKKAEEEARKAEEARKKAEEKAKKKEMPKISADLNENLSGGIKGRVSRAKPITQQSLLKDLTASQKEVITKYNNWVKNVYEAKKTKEQQKEIREKYLANCSSFNGLLGTINTFKGE